MARILVIDDEEAILETCRFVLEEKHSVVTAGNGKDGLARLKAEAFDLVITDLIMPEKDGIQLILEAKEAHPSLKILAISGGGRLSAGGYLETAETLGADAAIPKPFTATDLSAMVDALLA